MNAKKIPDQRQILYMVADYLNLKKKDTDGRNKFRRIVYLLQMYGIKTGYGFSWGKYGPFSRDLIENTILVFDRLDEYKESTSELSFSEGTHEKLDEFKEICKSIWNNYDILELVGCVHLSRSIGYERDKEIFRDLRKEHLKTLSHDGKITDKMLHEAIFFEKCLTGKIKFDPQYNIPYTRFELLDL